MIALLAVASDGYLADAEGQVLSTTLSRMQLFRSYPRDVMRRMFDRLLGILNKQGSNTLFNLAVDTLPHDLYETVFAVTTDIALADGEVTNEEEKLLTELCSALEIDEKNAVKIIDVMLVKNKG